MSETNITYPVSEIGTVLGDLAVIAKPLEGEWDEAALRRLVKMSASLARLSMKTLDPEGRVALALKAED